MFLFEEWVLAASDGFMRQSAPTQAPGAPKVITLLEYFSPTTFAFKLVNDGGDLRAVQECYNSEMHGDMSPRTEIVDSLADFTDSHHVDPTDVILRSTLPPVPVIPASKLERVSDGLHAEELSDIPTRVRLVDTNTVFFFKAGDKAHGHLRELEILSQINSSQVTPPLRTSKLVGLVVWDDDVSCLMGFLLEYIEKELQQTAQGDLIGLDHMAAEMGLGEGIS